MENNYTETKKNLMTPELEVAILVGQAAFLANRSANLKKKKGELERFRELFKLSNLLKDLSIEILGRNKTEGKKNESL